MCACFYIPPALPVPFVAPYALAARANKVARLRAMCSAQLGDDFAKIHGFLRSVRQREAERAGTLHVGAADAATATSTVLGSGSDLTSLVAIAAAAADIGGDNTRDASGAFNGGRGGGGDIDDINGDGDGDGDGSDGGLLTEEEVTSRLLSLVNGDEKKMAACYAVWVHLRQPHPSIFFLPRTQNTRTYTHTRAPC